MNRRFHSTFLGFSEFIGGISCGVVKNHDKDGVRLYAEQSAEWSGLSANNHLRTEDKGSPVERKTDCWPVCGGFGASGEHPGDLNFRWKFKLVQATPPPPDTSHALEACFSRAFGSRSLSPRLKQSIVLTPWLELDKHCFS